MNKKVVNGNGEYAQSDVLLPHAPLDNSTRGFIEAGMREMMQSSAVPMSAARGGAVHFFPTPHMTWCFSLTIERLQACVALDIDRHLSVKRLGYLMPTGFNPL
ncbi:hypothetical protein [Castellaniella sp.]|uniref:hypothetical protein n=1 Tax=Castellaniella sp. TaxID=1955812 RepID=UPI00355F026E